MGRHRLGKTAGMLALSFALAAGAVAVPAAGPAFASCGGERSSIVVDGSTGAVLSESRADEKRYPASMTKIMTLILVFDSIRNGALDMDGEITISANAAKTPPSKLGLDEGEKILLRQAITAITVKSANDMAVALAEAVAGTEEDFTALMNAKARDIGMQSSVFTNASGLPDPAMTTTARDMALLSRYLIENYPEYYKFFSLKNVSIAGRGLRTTNRLLNSYPGMDGIKTGFTCASGFNLAASAVRDGKRVIAVTFGHGSSKSRNAHMRGLLDEGFKKIRQNKAKDTKKKTAAAAPDLSALAAFLQGTERRAGLLMAWTVEAKIHIMERVWSALAGDLSPSDNRRNTATERKTDERAYSWQ